MRVPTLYHQPSGAKEFCLLPLQSKWRLPHIRELGKGQDFSPCLQAGKYPKVPLSKWVVPLGDPDPCHPRRFPNCTLQPEAGSSHVSVPLSLTSAVCLGDHLFLRFSLPLHLSLLICRGLWFSAVSGHMDGAQRTNIACEV